MWLNAPRLAALGVSHDREGFGIKNRSKSFAIMGEERRDGTRSSPGLRHGRRQLTTTRVNGRIVSADCDTLETHLTLACYPGPVTTAGPESTAQLGPAGLVRCTGPHGTGHRAAAEQASPSQLVIYGTRNNKADARGRRAVERRRAESVAWQPTGGRRAYPGVTPVMPGEA
jgi:hypothetical protein